MYQKIQMILASTGLVLGLCSAPVMAQSSGDSKMPISKMSGKDQMSKKEKAAMFDKMPDADKMAATKMAGHDMSNMSAHDRMAMTDKMDKGAMDKGAMETSDKMDKK